jgi:D-psicose/D-tagatose/L-ribulose 3-epimerase
VLDSAGLRASVCIAMSPERDLTTSHTATVQRTQEYLRRAIEAAAIVGSPAVGGPIYSPTGRTGMIAPDERQAILIRLAENLQPVLDEARRANVKLALEPINRFETSLFNTVDQALPLINLVNDPVLGLLLDTFHMNIEERDIPAAIRAAGLHLTHFHACGNDRGAPGDGSIPWPGIAAALEDVGYSGPLVIESFAGGNEVMAAAAAIWRPLAASQDDIATSGLAFLRSIFNT